MLSLEKTYVDCSECGQFHWRQAADGPISQAAIQLDIQNPQ